MMFADGIDSKESDELPFPTKTRVHLDHALIDMESTPVSFKVFMSVTSDKWMTLSKMVTLKGFTFYAKVNLPFRNNEAWDFGGGEKVQMFTQEVSSIVQNSAFLLIILVKTDFEFFLQPKAYVEKSFDVDHF